ncbi:MAG TPA: VacJ family lipoprotein [Methylibium sp.]
MRWSSRSAALALTLLLSACATASRNPQDPLEPWNRKVFAFNESVDEHVLKPAATVYSNVVPRPVRTAADNFFGNVKDVWSAINLMLQGRFADGAHDAMRFGANSVFGFFGIADVATEMGLERQNEDFGQTLGKWGVPPGAYIVWPILGSSTVRDSVGLPIDLKASPESFVKHVPARNTMLAVRTVNARADLLGATKLLDEIVLDKYTFIRDAYLQRRRSLIYDGEPPDDDSSKDWSKPDSPAPAAPAASQPADGKDKTEDSPADTSGHS